MNTKSFIECEREQISKWKNLQLPNSFKRFGYALFVLSLTGIFLNKFMDGSLLSRQIIKYTLLLGLLLVSVSKEKIEDEFITKLKLQSFSFAFVMGVVMMLIMPIIDYGLEMMSNKEDASFDDPGGFEVLFILLFIQVFYFEMLKRINS